MGFAVSADAYDRFMGRFSQPLAAVFADFAGVHGGLVLDVGCGPGALTAQLRSRGARVRAVDPSASFVAAARERHPEVEVLEGSAEALPFGDAEFDAALAQLVVHFMADPARGVAQMRRVTRPGGVVAACVWDHERGPLATFWRAVGELHEGSGAAPGEASRAGQHAGQLGALLRGAGLTDVLERAIEVRVAFEGFEAWWAPFELGVGPAGDHVAGLDPERRSRLAARCRALLPVPPFEVRSVAWAARGTRG